MTAAYLNILCPVDFSAQARTALGYAAALADHFKARLHIVTVTGDDTSDASTMEELGRFVAPITARVGRLIPEPALGVRSGVPGDVILRIAEEDRAELVVISTHGAGAASEPYGSTTLHVMRHAAMPLLIVPPALHAIPPPEAERLLSRHNVVLAPIDFDMRASRDARIAAGLAQAFDLDLVLLHVLSHAGRTRQQAEAMLHELTTQLDERVRTVTVVAAGDEAEAIARIAVERDAGVIVMGLRGERRTRGSVPGSIAYAVLQRAPSLVLALPEAPAWIAVRRTPREEGAFSGV